MAKVDYEALAPRIVELVGGEGNVTNFTHCITRLRFNVSSKDKVDVDAINAMSEFNGCVWSGSQLQIVVGTAVDDAYDAVLKCTSFERAAAIDENLDVHTERPHGIKGWFSNLLNIIVECMVPCIPLFMSMGLFSALASILGPQGFAVIGAEDGLYLLFTWAKDALMYGVATVLAYTASKRFNVSVVTALSLVLIVSATDLINAISGGTFNIGGIAPMPITIQNQSISIIVSIWIMKYVRGFWNKVLPNSFRYVFLDFLTLLVLVPLTIFVIVPGIYLIGMAIALPVSLLSSFSAPLASVIAAAIFIPLTSMGLHIAIAGLFCMDFITTGVNYTLMPVQACQGFILLGLNLAVMIRAGKNQRLKDTAQDCLIASFVGGVTEPTIYGILLRRPRTMIAALGGMASCALVLSLAHVGVFAIAPSSFLGVTAFLAGGVPNFLAAIPGIVTGMVVSFLIVMVLGVGEERTSGIKDVKFE